MRFYHPKNLDKRIIKKFALFPIRIKDTTYWLETIYIKQSYTTVFDWIDLEVVTKEKYEQYLKLKGEGKIWVG